LSRERLACAWYIYRSRDDKNGMKEGKAEFANAETSGLYAGLFAVCDKLRSRSVTGCRGSAQWKAKSRTIKGRPGLT
jgi:hypothetical protein